MASPKHQYISVRVVEGDAFEFPSDVLALKHAKRLFGADAIAYRKLSQKFGEFRLPDLGESALLEAKGAVKSKVVLFLGVPTLFEFGYEQIRDFARSVLVSLGRQAPRTAHVSLTIHGVNYGLDELEAFKAEIAGLLDAIAEGEFPKQLSKISFVEKDPARARRLEATLRQLLPDCAIPLDRDRALGALADEAEEARRSVGSASNKKPHVFVAMPFAKEMDDIFHYGIQGAVNAAGLLCERADLSSFAGDVMEWVKARISGAKLVVADLTSSNPNVYLEVGYAWGRRIPTVLIVRDVTELKFDVKGQRCIAYASIRNLEELLSKELQALEPDSSRPSPHTDELGSKQLLAKNVVYYDRVPQRYAQFSSSSKRAIASLPNYWFNGATLRIQFIGGSARQRTAVREIAVEWTKYANLRFQFTEAPPAEIRVAFDEANGSWSYIGTDAKQVSSEAPTMNLADTTRGTILHMFGRAIGLRPEHQNPAGGIQWNEPVVLRDLAGPPNYWDEATAKQQFFKKYSSDQINGLSFDPASVMLLPIPASWTLNGAGTKRNETLSSLDKHLAAHAYPIPAKENLTSREAPPKSKQSGVARSQRQANQSGTLRRRSHV